MEIWSLIVVALFAGAFFIVIVWAYVESLIRAYYAFHELEYIPTWITRKFHLLMITMARIAAVLFLIKEIEEKWAGKKEMTDFIVAVVLVLLLFHTKIFEFQLYNPDKNDSVKNKE